MQIYAKQEQPMNTIKHIHKLELIPLIARKAPSIGVD
jgi:hypothetical protein